MFERESPVGAVLSAGGKRKSIVDFCFGCDLQWLILLTAFFSFCYINWSLGGSRRTVKCCVHAGEILFLVNIVVRACIMR